MRHRIEAMVYTWLAVVALVVTPGLAQVGGSVLEWGDRVTGVDLSGAFRGVSCGGYHNLGLRTDGSIVAWGSNQQNQCSDPDPNSGFLAVAAGGTHNLGLRPDGSVVAWGDNYSGQCQVPSPNTGFIAIAAGAHYSLGLKAEGAIVAWGRNDEGQCNVPAPNSDFVEISAGYAHGLARKKNGSVVLWGRNDHGQCTPPSPNAGFVHISAGWAHNVATREDSSLIAWGYNQDGQCNVPLPNTGFAGAWAGSYHTLGLKSAGSIVAWGHNGEGQCTVPLPNSGFIAAGAGTGQSTALRSDGSIVTWGGNYWGESNGPTQNTGFVSVASGRSHSLALRASGIAVAWGLPGWGQCNIPSPNSGFTALSAGERHSLGLKLDGSIATWGSNSDASGNYVGQCDVPPPNSDFVEIAACQYHSLGRRADGAITGWGSNSYGQLDVPAPNNGFVGMATGLQHSLGLKSDGSVVAWGRNNYGQCDVPSPNTDFTAVAAGTAYSVGLKKDHSIVVWGYNSGGYFDVPAPNAGFVGIASGPSHILALRSDSSVAVWGAYATGKYKVPLPNIGFIAIAAGDYHNAALRQLSMIIADVPDLVVPEGGTAAIRVRLAQQPLASVIVAVAAVAGGDTDFSFSPASLTFTPANWDSYQQVTVSAAEDPDTVNGQAIIRCTSSGWMSREITVTEEDNDTPAIATDVSSLSIPEGTTASFQVKLTAQPLENLTVSLAKLAESDPDITISSPPSSTLTFTPTDWEVYQTVTLSAAQDADVVNGQATIRCIAMGLEVKDVIVTEQDDDTLGIVTDTTSLDVPENDSASFQVKLSAQPGENVTVAVSRADGDDPDITISDPLPAVLTFTLSDWDVYQSVTVSALDDADAVNGQVTIQCTAAGLETKEVTATEQDDDSLEIILDPPSLKIPEGGSASLQIKLGAQPPGSVTVELSLSAGSDPDITISSPLPSILVFTPENWDVDQTLTLSAAEDADWTSGQATVRCVAAGLPVREVPIVEEDNDIPSIVTDVTSVSVPEGGGVAFQVKLSLPVTENMTVSVAKIADSDPDITVSSPASGNLTFTPENWDAYQPVFLSAAEDADMVNGSATIRCSAAGLDSVDVVAVELENDTLSIVPNPSQVSVSEGGSASLQIKLNGQPAGNVVVSISKGIDSDPDITVSVESLIFTTANWSVFRIITLSAAEDADVVNGQAVIQCSAPDVKPCEVVATEQDNDTQSILTDTASVSVPEGGTASFKVRLSHQPPADVTVGIAKLSVGDPDISTLPATMFFTPTNWTTYQTVTVTAAQDVDSINGQAVIQCSASGMASVDVVAVEADTGVPPATWYRDQDGDGYGNANETTQSFSQPTGYVSDKTDCDDGKAAIHPGATEIADDGIDQDCNGSDLVTPVPSDADGDGVPDSGDLCPSTPAGASVNAQGCAASQLDADGDQVPDNDDLCPATSAGASVNAQGCAASQLDTDSDGVKDDQDLCSQTPAGTVVGADGCPLPPADADQDGVEDASDKCPSTPADVEVDTQGCSASQRDTDGDGVSDDADQCPQTSAGTSVEADGCPPDEPGGDDQPAEQARERPRLFRLCGAGTGEAMLATMGGLALMQMRRRRD